MKTIDDRLKRAAEDAHRAASGLEEPLVRRRTSDKGFRTGLVVSMAIAATVLIIGLPALLLSPEPGNDVLTEPFPQTPTSMPESSPPETALDQSDIPPQVAAYWALEGTLDSVGDETGWLCPPKPNSGHTSIVPEDQIPTNLKVSLPEETPQQVFNRDAGPICRQPPVLVLMEFADSTRLSASAGVAIWPQQSRWQDLCPTEADCSFDGGPIITPTINDQPAELHTHSQAGAHDLWWFDPNGVPLYAEASGISADQLVEIAEAITVDANTHQATVEGDAIPGFEVVSEEPSVGRWETAYWRALSYDIDGASVQVQTRSDTTFNPHALIARNVDGLELADIGATIGVWTPAHGNLLDYKTNNDVVISIEGAPDLTTAIEIARAIEQR